MIKNPKIGDVVYLDWDKSYGWQSAFKQGHRYIISEIYNQERSATMGTMETPVLVRSIRDGAIVHPPGVWARYLIRDEFMTAARNAIKQQENDKKSKSR